jgi:hypothetical protein
VVVTDTEGASVTRGVDDDVNVPLLLCVDDADAVPVIVTEDVLCAVVLDDCVPLAVEDTVAIALDIADPLLEG